MQVGTPAWNRAPRKGHGGAPRPRHISLALVLLSGCACCPQCLQRSQVPCFVLAAPVCSGAGRRMRSSGRRLPKWWRSSASRCRRCDCHCHRKAARRHGRRRCRSTLQRLATAMTRGACKHKCSCPSTAIWFCPASRPCHAVLAAFHTPKATGCWVRPRFAVLSRRAHCSAYLPPFCLQALCPELAAPC